MSFTMYMGMIVGMLAGVLSVVIALLIAKRKGVAPLVEEDERTELVKVRAGNLTFWAVGVFSFVGWVTDNIARHGRDLSVAFFSPWSIIFFAMIVIYIFACMYESWKVSDNDAAPDDKEMKVITGHSVPWRSPWSCSVAPRSQRAIRWTAPFGCS